MAKLYSHKGEQRPLSAWAEQYGLTYGRVYRRLQSGWSLQDALTIPLRATGSTGPNGGMEATMNGRTRTVREWSKLLNVPEYRLRGRLKRGFTLEEAITLPRYRRPASERGRPPER